MDLLGSVKKFLDEDEWHYQQVSENRLKAGVNCKNGQYMGYFSVRDDNLILVLFTMSYNVPENKRAAVAEYLARANYALAFGSFEMDFSDGEVRSRTSIFWDETTEPSTETLNDLITLNYLNMDRNFPAINSIVYGNTSPEEAFKSLS